MPTLIILDRDRELWQDAIVHDLALALYLWRHIVTVRLGGFRCAELFQRGKWIEIAEAFVRFGCFRSTGSSTHRANIYRHRS